MSSKSKSARVRSAARTLAARPRGRAARKTAPVPDVWEQPAEAPDEWDDEFDCQRIVQGDGGRSLPLYFDDYN